MTDYRRAGHLVLLVVGLRLAAELLVTLLWPGQDMTMLYALSALLLSIGAIYIPALLFIKRGRQEETYGRKRINGRAIGWSLMMGAGLFLFTVGANGLFQLLFDQWGVLPMETQLPPTDGWRMLSALILVVIIPPITEETLFRGALLNAWRPMGRARAILLTSLLFALFHFDVASIPAIFLLACFLGMAAYDLRTIYPGMIAHAVNNLISLALTVAAGEAVAEAPVPEGLEIIAALAVYVGLGLLLLFGSLRALKRSVPSEPAPPLEQKGGTALPVVLAVLLLLFLNAAVFAANMGWVPGL